MTRPSLLCLAFLAACAGGPSAPAATPDSARLAPALAEVELAIARKASEAVHERWVQASRAAPSDAVAAFLADASIADPEASWKALRDRADHHPREAWPHLGMARIYVLWDTWDQAAIAAGKAVQRAPAEPLLAALQGEIAAHQGDPTAVPRLEALATASPGVAEVHAALGRVLSRTDPVAARKEMEAALKLEPRDLRTLFALADLCAAQADAACARQGLEDLAHLTPADAAVQLRVAEMRHQAGDVAGAAPAYAAGQVVEKGDEAQVRRAIESFRAAGDAGSELAALSRLDRLHPQDVGILRRIAELKVGTGTDAQSAYAALFEVAPDDPAANLSVARAAAARGELYRAAVSFRRALAGGAAEAQGELAAIEEKAHVARPPLDGHASINTLAARVLAVVGKLAAERRAQKSGVTGSVVARVVVDPAGKAREVSIVSDSAGDPAVAACVYLNLLDARYPPRSAEYKLEIPVR